MTIDDVRAAADRIAGRVHRTPVVTSRLLDAIAGRALVFKCENLQRAGAFKFRGATNRMLALTPEERARGVVAFSSGNHAQAVALAASEAGVDAVVVMPADAPRAKLAATRAYGARVVTYDAGGEETREAIAARIVEEEGRVLVPPFDDAYVAAGQGTAMLELLEQAPELDAVVAPVGGGGLLAGVATAAADAGVAAWGAEPAGADDWVRSLEAGERVSVEPDTIADGARTPMPGELTWPIVRALAAGIVRVPDASTARAMGLLLTRAKLVVEPTGAVAAAAAIEGWAAPGARRVGVILSGGNVDPERLAGLVAGVPD